MWHRTQIGDLAIWPSVSNHRLVRGDQSSFSALSRVSSKEFSFKLHIKYSTLIWYSRYTFGCHRSVMQDTLPEEQATSWRCIGFRWRDYPNNSHQSLYVNLLKTVCGCLPIIRIKFRHLNSCVTGRLFLGWLCRNDPEYSSAITLHSI